MAYDIFELAIFAMLGVAGLFGGIPQLIRWTKPRPNLTITKVAIERLPGDNYKYQLHMEIENRSKFWRRNSDATNVNADYYMINKDWSPMWSSIQPDGGFVSGCGCKDSEERRIFSLLGA